MLITSPFSTEGIKLFEKPSPNQETRCSLVCSTAINPKPTRCNIQCTSYNVTSHTCCCCSSCCCLFFSWRAARAADLAGQQRWAPSAVLADADPHSSRTCEAASSCLPHPCMLRWHVSADMASPALPGLVADEACAGLHPFRSHTGKAGQGGQGRAGQNAAAEQGRSMQGRAGQQSLPRPEHVWSNDGLRHNFILLSIMAMPCDISQSN